MTPGELMEVLENVVDLATENGCHSEPKGTDELRKALQALADVRTLDAWATAGNFIQYRDNCAGEFQCRLIRGMAGDEVFLGATPDEARAKAAAKALR